MYQGGTIADLARTVEAQAARKDDLLVDTRELHMLNGDELSIPVGQNGVGQERVELPISQIAHRQIGERLKIPANYYDRLREATRTIEVPNAHGMLEKRDVPDDAVRRLLDTNVNTLLREQPETRMVRTFKPIPDERELGGPEGGDGLVRAFLSSKYRRLDNDEVIERIVPMLADIPGAKVQSCAITDTRLYLKVVTERVTDEVKLGDAVQAGVLVRNSEVGHGALVVQPFIFRLVCLNGMVVPDFDAAGRLSAYHVGSVLQAGSDYRVLSEATRRLDDRAFISAVGDVVRAAVDQTRFEAIVQQLRDAAGGTKIDNPIKSVERLAKRFALNDTESASVLRHLSEGGDFSAYGALNAITRTSQDVGSYERASELEVVGGQVLAIAGSRDWEAIAA